MSPRKAHKTFGSKGTPQTPQSYSQMLLSGRPLARPQVEREIRLKPRPKPKFGRCDGEQAVRRDDAADPRRVRGAALGALAAAAVVVCAGLLALALTV